jgi:ribosome-associated protein
MPRINARLTIPDDDIQITPIRAPGPGGQNVNKVATAVQLRFDARGSRSLPEEVRDRLIRLAGKRMTGDGVLVIEARRYRTRERNREDARDRLAQWIRKAADPPSRRRKTRPPAKAGELRLEGKHRRSLAKKARRPVSPSEG